MLINYFFWYSTHAFAFFGLFESAFNPSIDPEGAFPNLVKFRKKVSAHPAHAAPRKDDNTQSMLASINQAVTWNGSRYSVGREVIADNATGESSHGDWGWELTETHEDIESFIRRQLYRSRDVDAATVSTGVRFPP